MQTLNFYIAEVRFEAPGLQPDSIGIMRTPSLNTPVLGLESSKFPSIQKAKRICFSVELARAAITNKP